MRFETWKNKYNGSCQMKDRKYNKRQMISIQNKQLQVLDIKSSSQLGARQNKEEDYYKVNKLIRMNKRNNLKCDNKIKIKERCCI